MGLNTTYPAPQQHVTNKIFVRQYINFVKRDAKHSNTDREFLLFRDMDNRTDTFYYLRFIFAIFGEIVFPHLLQTLLYIALLCHR